MQHKIIACIIARTVSTRLPLKVLRNIKNNLSLLDVIIKRISLTSNIDQIYICTSKEEVDDILEDVALRNNVNFYRGSADEVIERMLTVGKKEEATHVIRITGDNIFTDPFILSHQIQFHLKNNLDYTRTENLPLGATAEVIKLEALKKCYTQINPKLSEYLMLYLFNPDIYNCGVVLPNINLANYTFTVDTKNDLQRTKLIANIIGNDFYKASTQEIINIINKHQIPYSIYSPQNMIKLPEGKEISFKDFRLDMENRINKSNKIFINLGDI